MKTVPILFWNHSWGVVQNLILGIGQALSRAGFKVVHLRYGTPELADEIRAALAEPETAFAISFGTYPIFELNGEPIWKYFPARTFIYFQDPPIYDMCLHQTWDLLREKSDRIAFGFTDAGYLEIVRSVIQGAGGGGQSLFLPVATPRPERLAVTPWRDRPYEIMYFGAVNTHRDYTPESLASYRNSFVPYDPLVAAVDELLTRGAEANVTAHLMARLAVGPEVLSDLKWLRLVSRVDNIVKQQRKLRILRQLAGHKVHLFGYGWENLAEEIPSYVLHGPLAQWTDHFEMIDRSRTILNIDPNFKHGINDRAFSGCARGSTLLTQDNPYVNSILGGMCLTYDQSGFGIGEVLSRPDSELEEMAAAGMIEARSHHTWDNRIAELIEFMAGLDARLGRPSAEASISTRSGKISIRKIKQRPIRQALRRLIASAGNRR